MSTLIYAIVAFLLITTLRLFFLIFVSASERFAAALRWVFRPQYVFLAIAFSMVMPTVIDRTASFFDYVNTAAVNKIFIKDIDDETTIYLTAELINKTDPITAGKVLKWTDSTAAAIGCTSKEILMVAACESGLNPFRIRAAGRAAGWIQFTPTGVASLPFSMRDVKRACLLKDADFIMRATHIYFLQKNVVLSNALDVYLAVFCPAKIGARGGDVLYSGYSNPAYLLNSGIDGWQINRQNGLVFRGKKDGNITAGELEAFMLRKTAEICEKHKRLGLR